MLGDAVHTTAAPVGFRFANFRLVPARELLLEDDKPVRIGSRALRILTALVERPGQLVGKNELIDIVWPETFVEEANLKVHISALRRILRDTEGRLIANVPGRGYCFTADVLRSEAAYEQSVPAPRKFGAVPPLLTEIIGREADIDSIATLLAQHRFATVVGAAGIGKTTVAIAMADRLAPSYRDGAWFVELSAVLDPVLVPSVIASALGLRSASNGPQHDLFEAIANKQMLLVLDNCEHLVQHVAELTETLLRGAGSLTVLATSREPLRAQGERVHRLPTLAFPADMKSINAKQVLKYSAIALFVERARANSEMFRIEDADAIPLVEICRQLDGLPLAIELAAARLQGFGLHELAARLADRFSVLTKGSRTAVPRHKTLRAALDWSFELLTPSEKDLLTRFGIFRGPFTLEVAKAVCAPLGQSDSALLNELSSLAEKSMIVEDASEDPIRYHLLEITKDYALKKLQALNEFDLLAARKAAAMRDLFATARQRWSLKQARDWVHEHRHWIGDVRASLDWALVRGRDIELGASLVLQTRQLWIDLGLLPEFLEWTSRALHALAKEKAHDRQIEMRLSLELGHTIYALGSRPDLYPVMVNAFKNALETAHELGEAVDEVRALVSHCFSQVAVGEYADVLPLADRVLELGRRLPDVDVGPFVNRAKASACTLMGLFEDVDQYAKAALCNRGVDSRAILPQGFDTDPVIFERNIEARILWMRGFPDQALALAARSFEDALSLGHLSTYIETVNTSALTVALWHGDKRFLDGPLERFIAYGEEQELDYGRVWRFYTRLAIEARAEAWTYKEARQRHARLNVTVHNYGQELLATYHPGFVLPHMLERARNGRAGWCAAEIIRAAGEERLSEGDFTGAERAFKESYDFARRQGSLAWELRSAMSLCRLDQARDVQGSGHDLLKSVYGRYDEGFGSADLKAAAVLLKNASAGHS